MKRKIKSAARIEGSSQANSNYRWSEWMTIQEGDPSIDGLKYRHYTNPEYPEVYGEIVEYDKNDYGSFISVPYHEGESCGQYSTAAEAMYAAEAEVSKHLEYSKDNEQYEKLCNILISEGYREKSVDTSYGSMSYFNKGNLCVVILNSSEHNVSNIVKGLI